MVRVSYDQKPYRRSMMQIWGGEVVASPSTETNSGRAILAAGPESTGSASASRSPRPSRTPRPATTRSTRSGSVLNHVLLHQTVIGQEAQKQMALAGDYPDVVIGCVGGGSNFAGIAFPFLADKIAGREIAHRSPPSRPPARR